MRFAKASYSQFGEDGILAWIFPPGPSAGNYIDVGCHHPLRLSNTAMFHLQRGWSGINIDPDERAIAEFERLRPGDINLCMGVAATAGEREMAFFEEGAINTFADDANIHPAYTGREYVRRRVPVAPLSMIVKEHWPKDWSPAYLNVDAESFDLEVLMSNDWSSFRPYCITVEDDKIDLRSPSASSSFSFLTSVGYRLMSHAAVTSFYTNVG